MRKKFAARAILYFLVCMAVLTGISRQVDSLMTPQVACVSASYKEIDGKAYDNVLPIECLIESGFSSFVLVVEENGQGNDKTYTVVRYSVKVLARDSASFATDLRLNLNERVIRYKSKEVSVGGKVRVIN